MKTILLSVSLVCALCLPSMATADELENLLRSNLDPRTIPGSFFDNNFKGLAVQGSARMFLDKAQAVMINRQVRQAVSDSELKKFDILSRTSAGGFTSVVYQYEVYLKVGQSTIQSKGVAHEIWENRNGDWFVIFGVQRE